MLTLRRDNNNNNVDNNINNAPYQPYDDGSDPYNDGAHLASLLNGASQHGTQRTTATTTTTTTSTRPTLGAGLRTPAMLAPAARDSRTPSSNNVPSRPRRRSRSWSAQEAMTAVIRYVVECPPHRLQLVNGTHFMVCTKCGRRYDVVNDEWRGQ